jgi:hypothetical protein
MNNISLGPFLMFYKFNYIIFYIVINNVDNNTSIFESINDIYLKNNEVDYN